MSLERKREIIERERQRLYDEVRAILKDELDELRLEAARNILRELGYVDDPEELPLRVQEEYEEMLDLLAEEVANRTVGNVQEQRISQHESESGRNRAISALALSTLIAVAAKGVTSAHVAGREQVVDLIVRVEAKPVMATRTAVLDKNTCEDCSRLHGSSYEYGGTSYYTNKPPASCQGRSRCRCQYVYALPLDIIAD